MDKFLGMLMFYTVTFSDSMKSRDYGRINTYLNSKAQRYLNYSISRAEWELLKILLDDMPIPGGTQILKQSHVYTLIHGFDKVFGLGKIDYKLRMFGIGNEMEVIDYVYDNLNKYISIVGNSNGVSVVLGSWLSETSYDRQLIEREINLNILKETW